MKLVYVFLLVLCSSDVFGQTTFQRNYRNAAPLYLWAAKGAVNNEYAFVGKIGSGASTINTYFVKTDSLGNQQCAKIYESFPQFTSWAFDVLPIKTGGFILTGACSDSLSTNTYLLRIDDTGKVLWSRKYGGSVGTTWGRYICQTKDRGFIVLGDVIGGTHGITDNGIFLIKTDSAGNLQWSKTYNTLGDWGNFIIENQSNGFYTIGGHSQYANPSVARGFLMQIDSVGNPIWVRGYGQSFGFGSYIRSPYGGYFFGGRSFTTSSNYGPYVLKTDSLFNPIWINQYANNNLDEFRGLQETLDGGCVLLAETNVGSNSSPVVRMMITRIDSTGTVRWCKAIGQTQYAYPRYTKQLNDTGYIILGASVDTSVPNLDFCFIKTDSSGNTCFSSTLTPLITSIPFTLDTFSFNVGSIDSTQSVTFIASNSGSDTLLCYNVNTSVTAPSQSLNDVVVFPNPSQNFVSFQSKEKIRSIEVFNSRGIKVYTAKPNSYKLSIDAEKYPEGVYFYKVEIDGGRKTGKLLIR